MLDILKIEQMSEDFETKLNSELDSASWDMLLDHHDRGAVFLVAPSVPLVKVGTALALDKTDLVSVWLGNDELKKVTDTMAAGFDKDPKAKVFDFLIVQPYVLIQYKKT